MFLTGKQRRLGEKLPRSYYGYAFGDFEKDLEYYYPIPINFIVRWGIALKWHWDKFRGKPSRMDMQIRTILFERLEKEIKRIERESLRKVFEEKFQNMTWKDFYWKVIEEDRRIRNGHDAN